MKMKSLVLSGLLTVAMIPGLSVAEDTSDRKVSILEKIEEFSKAIHSSQVDFKQLEKELDAVFVKLENVDPAQLDFVEIRRHTNQIIRASMEFRTELVQKIPQWQEQNVWTYKSETTVRNILRGLRYFEDAVGENSMGYGSSKEEALKFKSFTGGEPFVMTKDGSKFDVYKDVKPGDLILMRGGSEISAAIARVGDVNSQFSHLAIVTEDPKTKELFVAEALIEKGLTISPLKDFIDHAVGHSVIFRSEDKTLAAKASEHAWEYTHNGVKYVYDFTMKMGVDPEELRKDPKLFCTRAVKLFYNRADKNFNMPLNPTHLNPANRDFLKGIGIEDKTKEIFAPSDIELDHRFSVVAEYRDFSRTATHRIYDTIFDKVFQWMDEGGHFKESKMISFIARTAYFLSKITPIRNLAQKFGIPIAPHVKPNVLETVLAMAAIRKPLQKELQPMIDSYVEKYGIVPPPRIMSRWLEDIRSRNTNKAFKILQLGPKNSAGSCLKFYQK
jgi:hypothetical protein